MASKTGKAATQKSNQSTSKKGTQKDQGEKTSPETSTETTMDAGENLDSLLAMLDDEDLTDMDVDQAIEMIQEWHTILNEVETDGGQEIATSLKRLEKLLNDNADEADVGEVLTTVGAQVNEFANQAERGYKTKLHRLGKALTREGEELVGEEE
jgi:hypothetical protein